MTSAPFPIVVHHNAACGTSRGVVEIIREAGHEPVIIDYLREGWRRGQLLALFAAAGLSPRQALREKEDLALELGLLDDGVSADDILAAMEAHPVLVNRPIVATPKGVRLCRPKELVRALL